MAVVQVKMLGSFDLIVDGVSAIPFIGYSSKGNMLIKYLILNRDRTISVSELIDIFWSEPEKSINPENALKTMISRIRANAAKASPKLKNCILSEKRSYMWNPELYCEVDVYEFETLCHKLAGVPLLDEGSHSEFLRVMRMYRGDLASPASEESWIVSQSLYLHQLYLETIFRFIEFLKQENDYESIIYVCRIALDIDPLDEALNLELMSALKEDGQNNVALMQYQYVSSTYNKLLGIEPSDKLKSFYSNLIKSDMAAEADIGTIRKKLLDSHVEEQGAFVCDYSIFFKDIYQLQLRNLDRHENEIYLSLLTVTQSLDEPINPFVLESIMASLLAILRTSLRKGDVISRYSTTQFALLLTMANSEDKNIVIERIKKSFYAKYPDNTTRLTFQFGNVDLKDSAFTI